MTPLQNLTATDLLALGPFLVGATFVWSGAIKALAPHTFKGHLSSLGWIPRNLLASAVTLAAALEAGWGLALLLGVAPALLYPGSVAVLVVLTAISWWGVRSGRATDCGCYGGYVQPSIAQSIGLNTVFALLIIAAWATKPAMAAAEGWRLAIAVVGALAAGALAAFAQRFQNRHGRPLFDTSPLKVGKRWRDAWAGGATSAATGEVLVAFLGPDCPYCAQWVKVGNAIVQSPQLPKVVGVVASPKDRLERFIEENGIRFPVATVSQSLMGRLTQAVPTTVLVESGRIRNLWIGNLPPEFVDRLKGAFFPDAAKQPAEAV